MVSIRVVRHYAKNSDIFQSSLLSQLLYPSSPLSISVLQKLCLQLKLQLENVEEVVAEGSDFRWFVKVHY